MIARYLTETRGAAAVEFALWLLLLVVPLMNALDVGYYAFQAMQVRQAAQAAVESALVNCATKVPAATACANFSSNMTTAAQSTSLGTNVSVASYATNSTANDTFEGYFCSDTTNGLELANATSNPWATNASSTAVEPVNCGTTTLSTDTAPVGDYVSVTVTYRFHPIFPGVTVASLLPSTITQQAWMRLA